MKKVLRLASIIVVGFWCALAAADVIPEQGTSDGRIRTAAYSAEEVFRLHGVVGYQIDLQFEPGEKFVGMGAGDIEALSYMAQDNHLFIKPRATKVETNLTVLTTRRHYQILYTVGGGRADPEDEVIYSVRFTYQPPPADTRRDGTEATLAEHLRGALETAQGNTDYWYCGQPSLRPVAASDNGVHTRLRFSAQAELPAIFVRNDDGSESLLNFNLSDGDVIVHRVARRFIVRRGRLTGCIVNAAFTGGGTRLQSGTISPEVRRETQGVTHE